MDNLGMTPRRVVEELDKYIIGQHKAKRLVAVGLRNRYRRMQLTDTMKEEVQPKNLLMIGPTGVGKTEIARRLSDLVKAPFIKVEATKFTEVGYVGRDVESMVRDLVEQAIRIVTEEKKAQHIDKAREKAIKELVRQMKPGIKRKVNQQDYLQNLSQMFTRGGASLGSIFDVDTEEREEVTDEIKTSRRSLEEDIRSGKLDKEEVVIAVKERTKLAVSNNPAMEQIESIQETLGQLRAGKKVKRSVTVKEALAILTDDIAETMVNMDDVHALAIKRAEEEGIIFIDEIDKIAGKERQSGTVSRQGVQRDILPIVEGSQVRTKYGLVSTDYILFIGAGAFHDSKPSDLMPELQGRFPIRVELEDLSVEDFERILKEPKNALLKQYKALLATENIQINFSQEAIHRMAEVAYRLNSETENIGARRLHTILEKVLEELLFEASDMNMGDILITEQYVDERLNPILSSNELSHYIL